MPFDGIGSAFNDRVSKINEVIDLLATPDKWCKGAYETHDGRHCLRGAIVAVGDADRLRPVVLQAIREVTGKYYLRIESFNDRADTEHAQVLMVLGRARDKLMRAQPHPDRLKPVLGGRLARFPKLLSALKVTEPA